MKSASNINSADDITTVVKPKAIKACDTIQPATPCPNSTPAWLRYDAIATSAPSPAKNMQYVINGGRL